MESRRRVSPQRRPVPSLAPRTARRRDRPRKLGLARGRRLVCASLAGGAALSARDTSRRAPLEPPAWTPDDVLVAIGRADRFVVTIDCQTVRRAASGLLGLVASLQRSCFLPLDVLFALFCLLRFLGIQLRAWRRSQARRAPIFMRQRFDQRADWTGSRSSRLALRTGRRGAAEHRPRRHRVKSRMHRRRRLLRRNAGWNVAFVELISVLQHRVGRSHARRLAMSAAALAIL